MNELDVDSWNVTVAPRDLLENYCMRDSLVQLLSHAPTITDHRQFEKWVFVGKRDSTFAYQPKIRRTFSRT
jgi:hypothetical protein